MSILHGVFQVAQRGREEGLCACVQGLPRQLAIRFEMVCVEKIENLKPTLIDGCTLKHEGILETIAYFPVASHFAKEDEGKDLPFGKTTFAVYATVMPFGSHTF